LAEREGHCRADQHACAGQKLPAEPYSRWIDCHRLKSPVRRLGTKFFKISRQRVGTQQSVVE